ncbi:MAG: hypothetical protein ACFHHU_10330 [Porticoccaceae bacterium]
MAKTIINGDIDSISPWEISGWAYCSNDSAPSIAFYCGNEKLAVCEVNQPRKDVVDALGNDGLFGFSLLLPSPKKHDLSGKLSIYVLSQGQRKKQLWFMGGSLQDTEARLKAACSLARFQLDGRFDGINAEGSMLRGYLQTDALETLPEKGISLWVSAIGDGSPAIELPIEKSRFHPTTGIASFSISIGELSCFSGKEVVISFDPKVMVNLPGAKTTLPIIKQSSFPLEQKQCLQSNEYPSPEIIASRVGSQHVDIVEGELPDSLTETGAKQKLAEFQGPIKRILVLRRSLPVALSEITGLDYYLCLLAKQGFWDIESLELFPGVDTQIISILLNSADLVILDDPKIMDEVTNLAQAIDVLGDSIPVLGVSPKQGNNKVKEIYLNHVRPLELAPEHCVEKNPDFLSAVSAFDQAVFNQLDQWPKLLSTPQARIYLQNQAVNTQAEGQTGLESYIGKHKGEDIYVICSGPSLGYIAPTFFDKKTTIGVNKVIEKVNCTYVIAKEYVSPRWEFRAIGSGSRIFASQYKSGNRKYGLARKNSKSFRSDGVCYFNHQENMQDEIDEHELNRTDRLIVSWSTVASAMHLAYIMGAKNIILVGHDCGTLDEAQHCSNYGESESTVDAWSNDKSSYLNWLSKIEAQTLQVANHLRTSGKIGVYSLNPFINFGLEGHVYKCD